MQISRQVRWNPSNTQMNSRFPKSPLPLPLPKTSSEGCQALRHTGPGPLTLAVGKNPFQQFDSPESSKVDKESAN